jgi:hypothetical protein
MARHTGHHSLTATSGYLLLEIVTVAYILMALFAYMAWLAKPYGVNISQHILLPSEFDFIKKEVGGKSYEKSWIAFDFSFSVFSNAASMSELEDNGYILWGLLLSTAFKEVHCAAWSYSFATVTEKYLWRTSAILLGGECSNLVVILVILARLDESPGSPLNKTSRMHPCRTLSVCPLRLLPPRADIPLGQDIHQLPPSTTRDLRGGQLDSTYWSHWTLI